MARKLRLEYPGARYHIINRGNYRLDAFWADETKAAFEGCLFEACAKSGWILHAFVVMRNHYHLALETPEGNLAVGMQWFQGTFANRFNRFRDERGHLFQGRYKAILTEEGRPLGAVCDYIHLNPVRAGIVPVARLQEYRHSSYWYLHQPAKRPAFLRPQSALAWAGGIPDTPWGRGEYSQRLELELEQGTKRKKSANLCRGWAIGSARFKADLIAEFGLRGTARTWDEAEAAVEIRQIRWEAALARAMEVVGYTCAEALASKKSESWKMAVAAWMKTRTDTSNGWLSTKLALGHPKAFSRNLTDYRRLKQANDPFWRILMLLPET